MRDRPNHLHRPGDLRHPGDLRGPNHLQRREDGQATVELVALLPLLLIAALVAATLLATHTAGEQAGQAAQAGAMALLQGGDARAAARRALPSAIRARATIQVHGRRVTVQVRPDLRLPALESRLTGHATADAGPEP